MRELRKIIISFYNSIYHSRTSLAEELQRLLPAQLEASRDVDQRIEQLLVRLNVLHREELVGLCLRIGGRRIRVRLRRQ